MTLYFLQRALRLGAEFRAAREARRQLRDMSEHELRDLGIGRGEIVRLTAPAAVPTRAV